MRVHPQYHNSASPISAIMQPAKHHKNSNAESSVSQHTVSTVATEVSANKISVIVRVTVGSLLCVPL